MKHWRLWLGLVVVLIVAGFALYTGYIWWLQFPLRQVAETQIVSPTRTTIVREVPAFGIVTAPTPIAVDFDIDGAVAAVHVARGDSVAAGQPIAELDRTALELAAESAQAGVRAAQAQLDKLQRTPSAEDIAVLEAGVDVARSGVSTAEALLEGANANLVAATAGSPPEEVAIGQKRIEDAKAGLWGAQAQRDAICGRVNKGASEADCDNANAVVSQAEQAVKIAELQLQQLQAGPRAEDIAPYQAQVQQSQSNLNTARAQLAQAEAAVTQALQAALPEDIAAAQAAVDQAEAALAEAQQQLVLTELRAPVSGIITTLDVAAGQVVAAGQAVATVTDLSALEIVVLVNEGFITEVQLGQPCRVQLEAYPDKETAGTVARIVPMRQSASAGANYEVSLTLDAAKLPLHEGMAVEAWIETGRSAEALAVPKEVLRLGEHGWYVERLAGHEEEDIPVTIGLHQGRMVAITGDVAEDDRLVLARTSLGTERGDYRWLPFGLFWRVN